MHWIFKAVAQSPPEHTHTHTHTPPSKTLNPLLADKQGKEKTGVSITYLFLKTILFIYWSSVWLESPSSCGVWAWLPSSKWDLISLTWARTHVPHIERQILYHQTSREVPLYCLVNPFGWRLLNFKIGLHILSWLLCDWINLVSKSGFCHKYSVGLLGG